MSPLQLLNAGDLLFVFDLWLDAEGIQHDLGGHRRTAAGDIDVESPAVQVLKLRDILARPALFRPASRVGVRPSAARAWFQSGWMRLWGNAKIGCSSMSRCGLVCFGMQAHGSTPGDSQRVEDVAIIDTGLTRNSQPGSLRRAESAATRVRRERPESAPLPPFVWSARQTSPKRPSPPPPWMERVGGGRQEIPGLGHPSGTPALRMSSMIRSRPFRKAGLSFWAPSR